MDDRFIDTESTAPVPIDIPRRDRQLLPARARVGQDRRQEAVGAGERLGFALEVDLVVLVEVLDVLRGADVEDGVELVAFDATEVQLDEPVDVLGA